MWYYTGRQNQQNNNMQSIICCLHNPFLCSFTDVFRTNRNGILMPWLQICLNAALQIYHGNEPPATSKKPSTKKYKTYVGLIILTIRVKSPQQLTLKGIRMPVWRRITRLPHKRLQIHLCVEMQRINGFTMFMRWKPTHKGKNAYMRHNCAFLPQ